MSTNETPNQKGSHDSHSPRPRYIYLGEDTEGGTHLYRTVDETIFAVTPDGRLAHRFDLDDARTVDHYVAHVRDARGWYNLTYGLEALFAPLEGL
jgi:hypothetical protein